MKKARFFIPLIALLFLVSGCTPSPSVIPSASAESTFDVDQHRIWKSQAEEIASLLGASLYDAYDVDLNVYNTSGEITAFVKVLSDDASRRDFGVIIGAMGDCFLDLVDEYSGYSFDYMTFFYYYTNQNGIKSSESKASITYNLKSNGDSTFLERGADTSMLSNKTPEEIFYHLSGESPDPEPTSSAQEELPSPDPTVPPQEEPSAEPSKTAQEEPIQTVTTGQRNALSKANQYLSIMAFSHSGLVGQLEFDGYTEEEATYGADNCGADWNEQAAKKAQQYIDLMSFSRQRLIDQLKFDGFTQSQAEYGASAVGY